MGTCFSEDCIRSHGYVPLRLCQECFTALHLDVHDEDDGDGQQGLQEGGHHVHHVWHSGPGIAWGTSLAGGMVGAIVNLLKETSLHLDGCEGVCAAFFV